MEREELDRRINNIRESFREIIERTASATEVEMLRNDMENQIRLEVDKYRQPQFSNQYHNRGINDLTLNQFSRVQTNLQNPYLSNASLSNASGLSIGGSGLQNYINDTFNLSSLENKIHREDGPAIYLDNNEAIYYWHGTKVPGWIIMHPERITVKKILKEKNLEVRRVMIERFGKGKFLTAIGGKKEHEDQTGILWKVEQEIFRRKLKIPEEGPTVNDRWTMRIPHPEDNFMRELFGINQKIKFVELQDASTERIYFLQVPSTMKRARQAVSWSFGMKEEEYQPLIES